MNTHRVAKLVLGFMICGVLAAGVTGAQAANNVGDLSLALAKDQGIPATDAQSAWKALQAKKWIPAEVFFTDPVSANVAQVIAIGMIKSGQNPKKVAIALTSAASIAAVPLKEAVQGIVAAGAAASGISAADAANVVQASAQGSADAGAAVDVAAITATAQAAPEVAAAVSVGEAAPAAPTTEAPVAPTDVVVLVVDTPTPTPTATVTEALDSLATDTTLIDLVAAGATTETL